MRPFTAPGLLAAVAALVLALGAGCDSDEITEPQDLGGWIEGFVLDGGDGDLAGYVVRVESLRKDEDPIGFDTRTDAGGYYRIGVPEGPVRMFVDSSRRLYHAAGGPTYRAADADTLTAGADVLRADFVCGRAQVVIGDGLDAPDGLWDRIELHALFPDEDGDLWADHGVAGNTGLEDVGGAIQAEFRMLAPGLFAAVAWGADPYGGPLYLPASYRRADADTFRVRPRTLAAYATETPEPITISGTLAGAWLDLGFSPPRLAVCPEHGWSTLLTGACDHDGRFELTIPAAGDFQLLISVEDSAGYDGGPDRWYGGGHDRQLADVFTLECGGTLAGLASSGSGLAVAMEGDPDADGIWLTAYPAADPSQNAWNHASTREEPATRIANVEPGSYYLRLETNGLAIPVFHDGATSLEESTPVDLPAGEIVALTVETRRGGRILGRLVAPGGGVPDGDLRMAIHDTTDIADALYWFFGHSHEGDPWLYDRATGEFVIRRLPGSVYKLRIYDDAEGRWLWYPGVPEWAEATPVPVAEGSDVTGIVWQL